MSRPKGLLNKEISVREVVLGAVTECLYSECESDQGFGRLAAGKIKSSSII